MSFKRVDRNELARMLTEVEGLKKQISIAQMKEVIRDYNQNLDLEEVISIWQQYN